MGTTPNIVQRLSPIVPSSRRDDCYEDHDIATAESIVKFFHDSMDFAMNRAASTRDEKTRKRTREESEDDGDIDRKPFSIRVSIHDTSGDELAGLRSL